MTPFDPNVPLMVAEVLMVLLAARWAWKAGHGA
jgi:hypothetical protein